MSLSTPILEMICDIDFTLWFKSVDIQLQTLLKKWAKIQYITEVLDKKFSDKIPEHVDYAGSNAANDMIDAKVDPDLCAEVLEAQSLVGQLERLDDDVMRMLSIPENSIPDTKFCAALLGLPVLDDDCTLKNLKAELSQAEALVGALSVGVPVP